MGGGTNKYFYGRFSMAVVPTQEEYDAALVAEGVTEDQLDAEIMADEHAKGISFDDIAEAFGCRPSRAMDLIKRHIGMEGYRECIQKAAEARRAIANAVLNGIVQGGRQKVLEKIESKSIEDIADLCKIEKTYGDRLAIRQGEDTERVGISIISFVPPDEEGN